MRYGFNCLTNSDPAACAIGEAQLVVDVTAAGANAIDLMFMNLDDNDLTLAGGVDPDPTIKTIYFDTELFTTGLIGPGDPEGTFNLSFVGRTNGPGTEFEMPKLAIPSKMSPPDLPGSENSPFDADFGFEYRSADSKGIQEGGEATGEWLKVRISQLSLSVFEAALEERKFDIGLHVGAFGAGSESFTLLPPAPVPLPAGVWLFGTALLGFIGYSRRRSV